MNPRFALEQVWTSLVLAARGLSRRPGFALAAVLTLAVAIGANTAVFSVVDAVVLRPLPFPEPHRLSFLTREGDVSIPDGVDWRARTRTFDEIALFLRQWNLDLTGEGDPERIYAAVVEPSYFRILPTTPVLGRALTAEDDRVGTEPVAVLSEAFWKRRFGGDSNVLGRTLVLSGQPTRVVGVMPAAFDFQGDDVDLWVPVATTVPWALAERGTNNFDAIGRLRPGVSMAAARAEMVAITTRLAAEYPQNEPREDRRADADARFRDRPGPAGAPRAPGRRAPGGPRRERQRGRAPARPPRRAGKRVRRAPGPRRGLPARRGPGPGREPRPGRGRRRPGCRPGGLGPRRAPGPGAFEPAPRRERRARRPRPRLHPRAHAPFGPARGRAAGHARLAHGARRARRRRRPGGDRRGSHGPGAVDAGDRGGGARERPARRLAAPRAQLPPPAVGSARLRAAGNPHRRRRPPRVALRHPPAADARGHRDRPPARERARGRDGSVGHDAPARASRRPRGNDSHRGPDLHRLCPALRPRPLRARRLLRRRADPRRSRQGLHPGGRR